MPDSVRNSCAGICATLHTYWLALAACYYPHGLNIHPFFCHHWVVVAAKLNQVVLKSLCTLICSTSFPRQVRQHNLLNALFVLWRKWSNRKLPLRTPGGAALSSLLLSLMLRRAFHLITSNNCSVLSNTSNKILDLHCWGSGSIAVQRKQFSFFRQREISLCLTRAIKLGICYCHNGKLLLEFTVSWKHSCGTAVSLMRLECEYSGMQACSMKQSDWSRRLEKLYQNLNGI